MKMVKNDLWEKREMFDGSTIGCYVETRFQNGSEVQYKDSETTCFVFWKNGKSGNYKKRFRVMLKVSDFKKHKLSLLDYFGDGNARNADAIRELIESFEESEAELI